MFKMILLVKIEVMVIFSMIMDCTHHAGGEMKNAPD